MENPEKKFSDVSIKVEATGETRKPAFAFFNRDVNLKHVDLIFEKMKAKGYRESAPIQVIKGEEANKFGIVKLFDLNEKLIPENEFNQFNLVVEGQHRTYAVSKYNDWLKSESKAQIEIPAVEVQFKNGESLVEYLNEINITLKEWTKEDFLKGAANVNPEVQLLQKYKELIKTESNPSGFSLSTLNLIYFNSGGLNKNDLVLLCYGFKTKGKGNKEIISGHDLETGNRFIDICKKASLRESEIAKRYLISEFNDLRNSSGGKELAFKVFTLITPDDVHAMLNKHEHLDEEKVIFQIKVVLERYQASLINEKEDAK